MGDFRTGDIAYIIESNRFIREGKIRKCSGGIYLFQFIEGGGIQVKKHRLFKTEEAAQAELDRINGRETKEAPKRGILPYDVGA